jgi:uncharacterized protein (DUF2267 family)
MRVLRLLAAGLLVAGLGAAAHGQAKKPAPTPNETVRYFQLSDDFLGDLPAEGFLKETRQGARITSAVLDVCHSVSLTSPRKDRFVVALKAEGTRLTGSAQTQEGKQQVAVNLVRKPAGKTVSFEGSITVGNEKWDVSSTGNTDVSEKEFLDNQANDSTVVPEPADFIEVSPGAVAVRAKRDAFAALVKEVRKENVETVLESLAVDCLALRTGEQELQVLIDPDRASALINKLKDWPGVLAAGWFPGAYAIERAVRFAAADWKAGSGSFDRERLASAIADSIAANFSATVEGRNWNDATGELKVSLKRPSQSIPGLDLSDHIETVLLIGPEKLRSNDALIVWVGDIAIDIVDTAPEPRLKFMSAASEENDLIDEDALLDRLAKDLKGKRWDSDQGAWK